MKFRLSPALLGLLLGACAAGPEYQSPAFEPDSGFHQADDPHFTAAAPEQAWWRTLGDAQLAALVERALVANHDVLIAQANVRAARAVLREDRLSAFPVVTVAGSVSRENASAASAAGSGRTETFYDAGFDAVWELDFFGRVRRGVSASAAEYEAARATRHDAAVIVAAEVARSYIELRGAQHQLDVALRNASNQQRTYDLTRVLAERGRGNSLDVARAQAQLETTLAGIEPLQAAVGRSIHRLGVLVGERPGKLADELTERVPLPEMPVRLPVGTPADLLRRRADVRAAERRLAAATARIGVAAADLFPRISLLGTAGFLATSGDAFGDSGSKRTAIGPFLSWPAFDLGRVRARMRAADANADARLSAYEKTVLLALEETESTLLDFARSTARLQHLEVAAGASERAVELARFRYRNGLDSFLNVLDAERRQLEAEDELARAVTGRALTFVALYKALGGGWDV
ncbi:MAG: efflux transporter outer membrane subunit [Pseudomonadota bacterium]